MFALELARVSQGFAQDIDDMQEIIPEVKGDKIIYKTDGVLYYVTTFSVSTRDTITFKKLFKEIMPATRSGNSL